MASRGAFGVIVLLAVACLAACASATVQPTSTATGSPVPSQSPSSGPTPTANYTLLPESLSWTGMANGTLTEAYATCRLPDDNFIDLRAADDTVDLGLPVHSPGIVVQSLANLGVSLHVQPGVGPLSYTLFLGAAGSATYAPDGVSGSVDAWLAPQSNVPTSPSVHITGKWRCR
jgi:hypothetical protein